jgi:hypothetical protein
MKKIIIVLKILLTNWINLFGLVSIITILCYVSIFFYVGINAILDLKGENLLAFFIFPLYFLMGGVPGYLFFQFLIDSIFLFLFKFSIKKTIRVENYLFILLLVVVLFFTILIQYSENKIEYYEAIKFSLIGVLILILCSSVFIYTQKKRIKKLNKIL